ncbi:hypothetical protein PR202_ga28809 [Eleusine coracana subsp. coracana]|uniref:DNA-directed RNA polymerase III subunit RPC3 n=1 Tax=Eleusine coracana subsp. coracana TaxID=191504 RepID=A0AAV5DKQ5_ELECO|nr:hypothetical protein PR202_ga28809 [Eleusine coracana subsp. coracana]
MSLSQKVLSCLLRHGPLSLQEIARRVELSPGRVKNALLVLIQHNWAADKTVTLYLAIFDNVLHRLCFTKFLSVIREDIRESESLIEGLLLNGRLTFDQLVERIICKISGGSTIPKREEIRMNFNKLVSAHYVERCPKPEPFFDPLVDEQPTSSRKRAFKTIEEVLSLEQKVVCTAVLSDAERFSEIPYFMEDSSNANDSHHQSIAGSKFCAERKKAKLKLDTHFIWEAFLEANVTNKDKKSANNNMNDNVDISERTNLNCILSNKVPHFVVTSPINGILERLRQKEGGSSMTLHQLTGVLNDLECISTSANSEFTFGLMLHVIYVRLRLTAVMCFVDLNKLVETCRNDEIESLVKKKYGQEAYVIFRLLVKHGCPIETDQVSNH